MSDNMDEPEKDVPVMAHGLHQFTSGAKSSGKLPSYHLIPWEVFADRLALRYMEGAEKYGEGNWESGLNDRKFIADRANHMLEHAHKAVRRLLYPPAERYPLDDDLAAVIWGAIFLMAAQNRQAKMAGSGHVALKKLTEEKKP
jgi:hypothetical protein